MNTKGIRNLYPDIPDKTPCSKSAAMDVVETSDMVRSIITNRVGELAAKEKARNE